MTPDVQTHENAADSTAPTRIVDDSATEGQRLLRAVDASLQTIATRIGMSKALVGHWRTGHKTPGPEMRRLLATLYGIPIASWDMRPVTSGDEEEAPPKPAKPATRALGRTTSEVTNRAGAEQLLAEILEQRSTPGLAVREFVQLCDAETRTRALIERMEQAEQLTDTRIATSPTFTRLRNLIFGVLRDRYPEALRAVVEALQGAAS